uniref:KxDL motif-containing protein CG10681-like n=1 Tax=Hirondellea gigas TaxID=1518452 RepID=A0A2P2ICQ9_9CRUS
MAGPTIGSEGDSIECWENYTAGEVMVQGLAGQIHQEDVEAIVRAQKQMLQRFEKTNEMLSNCNALSASRYATAHQEFAKHSTMLLQAKKDLDYIFKKIRNIRSKLETQFPQAVAAVAERIKEEDEEGEDALTHAVNSVAPQPQQQQRAEPRQTQSTLLHQSHSRSNSSSNNIASGTSMTIPRDSSNRTGSKISRGITAILGKSSNSPGTSTSMTSSRDSDTATKNSSSGGSNSGCGASAGGSCKSGASGDGGDIVQTTEASNAVRGGGGEESLANDGEEVDQDYQDAIMRGKVKRISGKLHHVSSSDSSTSSTKSSYSSSDS